MPIFFVFLKLKAVRPSLFKSIAYFEPEYYKESAGKVENGTTKYHKNKIVSLQYEKGFGKMK